MHIDRVKITDSSMVANILSGWLRYKVCCFLKYDADDDGAIPSVVVGRPYSSSKAQPVSPEDGSTGSYRTYLNEHMAQSNLKVVKTDPRFLTVTDKVPGTDEKFLEVTVRMSPECDPAMPGNKEFQAISATQISKKTHKVTGNAAASGTKARTKVDLPTYTIVPYMSPHVGINSDRLIEETTECFRSYNLNGITGNVTVFGDFGLSSAVQVELIDYRNSSKNGIYPVEEAITTFGVGGCKQQLSIPYKIGK